MSAAMMKLRAECNRQIQRINKGRGTRTPGFTEINRLLKACDAVFATAPLAIHTPVEALLQLRDHQEQFDTDGARVVVSRQALDEVLSYFTGSAV